MALLRSVYDDSPPMGDTAAATGLFLAIRVNLAWGLKETKANELGEVLSEDQMNMLMGVSSSGCASGPSAETSQEPETTAAKDDVNYK